MFRVRAKYLLLIAAAVWFLAGVNIMRLGVIACLEGDAAIWLLVIGIPVVFVVFHCMFSKLVGKHADRIRGYGEDKMHVLRFFDVKGYVIMAIMMGGGISLRAFGIVPGWFVAFFYTASAPRWPWPASDSWSITSSAAMSSPAPSPRRPVWRRRVAGPNGRTCTSRASR